MAPAPAGSCLIKGADLESLVVHPVLLAKTEELEADVGKVGGQLLRRLTEGLIEGVQQPLGLFLGDDAGLHGRLYPSWQHRHMNPLADRMTAAERA